jgi:glycine cleavage system H protein
VTLFSCSYGRVKGQVLVTNIPADRRYTKEHEWALKTTPNQVRVGITDFAQKSLGDIVFVELPKVNAKFEAGEPFGTVESVKAVSELYAPLSGTVVAVNEDLNDDPELVNTDPYGAWMIELKVDGNLDAALGRLLDAAAYKKYIEEG